METVGEFLDRAIEESQLNLQGENEFDDDLCLEMMQQTREEEEQHQLMMEDFMNEIVQIEEQEEAKIESDFTRMQYNIKKEIDLTDPPKSNTQLEVTKQVPSPQAPQPAKKTLCLGKRVKHEKSFSIHDTLANLDQKRLKAKNNQVSVPQKRGPVDFKRLGPTFQQAINRVDRSKKNAAFTNGGTLRVNEDQVTEEERKCEEAQVPGQEGLNFFTNSVEELQKGLDLGHALVAEFTSLRHCEIFQSRRLPMKRDLVQQAFKRDLEVFRITKSFRSTLRWMINKGMLFDSRACPHCGRLMRISNSFKRLKDGLIFKCTRVECVEVRVGIREGTIFDNNVLTLMEVLRITFYYFTRGFNALQTFRELKEFGVPKLQYQYVYDIYRKIRYLIHLYFQNHYRKYKLGQFGRSVEIDESKFTHHTKGGIRSKVWVLGFYERGTKDVRAFVMQDRTEVTCTRMIRDNIVEGAEIFTDFWRGYNSCKDFYVHRFCNKARYGYGTSEYQTTSRVESLWSVLKRNIYTYSTIRFSTLQRFLDEACWRIKFRTFEQRNEFLMQLLNIQG